MYKEDFFNQDFFTGKRGIDRTKPWVFWEMFAKRIIEIFPNKTIAEIGCGVGQLVNQLNILGADARGFDISDWAVEHVLCNKVSKGDVRSLPKGLADIVICWNVVEYLEEKDINRALESLRNSFKEYLLLRCIPIECWSDRGLIEAKEWGRNTFKPLEWWQCKYFENKLIPVEWIRYKFFDVLKGDGYMYPTFFIFRKMAHDRSVEIPWLLNQLKEGNSLDIGSAETQYILDLEKKGDVVLVDVRPINYKGKAKTIMGDIRKFTPKELGYFDNVLLISTLEHIGLKAYGYGVDWKDSPVLEQLRTFRHCMDFLKEDGRMLFTIPYGKYEDAGWLLNYDKKMINNIKERFKVVNETYFTLKNEKYVECKEEECPLLGADIVPGIGMRATSVVCLTLEK